MGDMCPCKTGHAQVHPVHSSYWNQVEGSFQVDLSHHCTLTILGKQGYSIIDRRIVD